MLIKLNYLHNLIDYNYFVVDNKYILYFKKKICIKIIIIFKFVIFTYIIIVFLIKPCSFLNFKGTGYAEHYDSLPSAIDYRSLKCLG